MFFYNLLILFILFVFHSWACAQLVPTPPEILIEPASVAAFESKDYVEPRLDINGVDLWIDAVNAPPEMRDVVRSLYSIYFKEYKALVQKTELKVEALGRSKILPREEGFPPIDYGEAKLIRQEMFSEFLNASREADEMLLFFLDQIDMACTLDTNIAIYGKAVLLNYVYLAKRREYLPAWGQAPWVDAAFLWYAARKNFRGISAEVIKNGDRVTQKHLMELLPWLEDNAKKDREYRFKARMARGNLDAESCKDATRYGMRLWSELDELNAQYIKQLENFVGGDKIGSESGYWKNEYAGKIFPMLAAESKTLQLAYFLDERLTDSKQVGSVLGKYGDRLRLLTGPIAKQIRKVRKESGLDPWTYQCLPPSLSPEEQGVHDQMLQASGSLANAHLDTYKELFDLLDEEGVRKWEEKLFRQ